MIVVIDPGHGGSDPGAIGPGGTREADINLAVSSRLAALLIREKTRGDAHPDGERFFEPCDTGIPGELAEGGRVHFHPLQRGHQPGGRVIFTVGCVCHVRAP